MTLPDLDQKQRDAISMGLCPFCEKQVKGYKPPFGPFVPQAWQTLREAGLDPGTGHAASCSHKEIRL